MPIQLDILVSMIGGMMAGVVGDYLYVQAHNETELTQEARHAVDLLNQTIRHEADF